MNKMIWGIIIVVLVIGSLIIWYYVGKEDDDNKDKDYTQEIKQLEDNMTALVTEFYNENLEDFKKNPDSEGMVITVENLKAMDLDTSVLKNPETGEKCTKESYSMIILDKEAEDKYTTYEIYNYLECGNYKSPLLIQLEKYQEENNDTNKEGEES